MTRATSQRAPRSQDVLAAIPPRSGGGEASPRHGRSGRARLSPTVARWPLDLVPGVETLGGGDPSMAIVRRCLVDYRSGRADQASRAWHDDVTWSVPGPSPIGGEWIGPDRIFGYHALLERLSEGTFRQTLVALEGSRGSIVDAYLRTTATRKGRRLEIPTLAVFELVGGRVRRVTEMPGDHEAWNAFWAD
jgi:ketosteroid isomerase-like protein